MISDGSRACTVRPSETWSIILLDAVLVLIVNDSVFSIVLGFCSPKTKIWTLLAAAIGVWTQKMTPELEIELT